MLAPVERPIRSLIAELQQQAARSGRLRLRRSGRDGRRQAERARLARMRTASVATRTMIRPSSGICTIWRRSKPTSARRQNSRGWCSKPLPPTPEGEGAARRRLRPNASP